MKKILAICFLFMFASVTGALETASSDSGLKKVIVFKNGLGFFIKEINSRTASDKIETDVIPETVLGTVWITGPSGVRIEKVAAGITQNEVSSPAADYNGIIAANSGKKARILYSGSITYEGVIKNTDEGAKEASTEFPPYSRVFYLETGKQTYVLKPENIISIEFPGNDFRKQVKSLSNEKKMLVYLSGKTSKPVNVSYIRRGISWVPSYLIDISRKDTAVLSMKAVLINESEDMNGCDVDLAVGYPNFMYQNTDSPLSLGANLQQFLLAINRDGSSAANAGVMSNIAYQSVSYSSDEDASVFSIPDSGKEVSSNEDFHLYSLKNVSARKGERIYYDIFSREIAYEHIYTWDIPETAAISSSGYYQALNREKTEQVWHIIKLKNSTSEPWTTATAFTVNRNRPVAQDMLKYTPAGTDARVKLTVSPDIKIDRKEEESGRQQKVKLSKSTVSYDHVEISGELYIKNTKSESISVEITKKLTGEVTEADLKPQIIKEVEGLNGVNYKSSVKWEITLKKGESRTIRYKYKIYVRN